MEESSAPTTPVLTPRSAHRISRQDISDNALKVMYRLHKAGYSAYLVGGSVRDLLLGLHPKDFDVATDASPEQVKQLFKNCRLIGRRFRLAHIHFGREIIEVATFRGHHDASSDEDQSLLRDGMLVRDNVYGTLEEDAWRRDFTINALYYNIADFSVVDYTGGLEDLDKKRLRMIGETEIRIQEDPVRMLRAIRFAAKLGFNLDSALEKQLAEQKHRLQAVPPARLFDEVLKLFLSGYGLQTYRLLRHYNLFGELFAISEEVLATNPVFDGFVEKALENTDKRILQDKPVTPSFLFAVMLWGPVQQRAYIFQEGGMTPLQALQEAGYDVIQDVIQQVSIPKRFRLPMREIWTSQQRLTQRRGKRALRLFTQIRFRAAYDFMLLRNQAGEAGLEELCEWWTRFQEANEAGKEAMLKAMRNPPQRRRSRRKSH